MAIGRSLVFIFLIGLLSASVHAEECKPALGRLLFSGKAPGELERLVERFDVMDFASADPAKNLAIRFPSALMSSAQRVYAIFNSLDPYQIVDPVFGVGEVTIFPLFEGASPLTQGRMIVGSLDAKSEVVESAMLGAGGDGSQQKIPVLVGPSGTGKSEFVEVFRLGVQDVVLRDPNFKMLTFQWIRLKDIPEVSMYTRTDPQGNEIPRLSEFGRSPFVLFPKDMQDSIIAMGTERVRELCGFDPIPVREPGPQSQDILNGLYRHYSQKKGHSLTDEEFVTQVLAKHIEIVGRDVVGRSMAVKMDPQTGDVNYGDLLLDRDPINRSLLGQNHPASYHFGGSYLQSDGGILSFDELYRNRSELLEKILGFLESGEFYIEGAPRIWIDTMRIATTNDESIDAAKKKGTMNALRSRSTHIPMRRSIHPIEIAKTLLLMKGEGRLVERKLQPAVNSSGEESEPTEWEPASLNQLFPLPTKSGYQGFNRRYAVAFKHEEAGRDVFVAPHTIEFLSNIIAATRLVTEIKDPEITKEGMKVINSAVFRNPIDRLRFLNGELDITIPEREELKRLHMLLREGEGGIDQRDAAFVWLSDAVDRAASAKYDYTLTPDLILTSFKALLDSGKINYMDQEQRLRWLNLADAIQRSFLVRKINRDVMYAFSSQNEIVNQTYDIVRAEILALASDEEATTIRLPDGQSAPIRLKRLEQIQEVYKRLNGGRPLVLQEVMMFHADDQNYGRQHLPLREAITEFLANGVAEFTSLAELASFATTHRGSAETRSRFSDFARIMTEELGYNERSLAVALQIVAESRAREEQIAASARR